MNIGIVILHWKNKDQTEQAIVKLLGWDIVDPVIFLVQNESGVDAFPHLVDKRIHKLYSSKNLGFGGGNNIGLESSISNDLEFTLLLNTDAEIEEQEFLKLLRGIKSDRNIFSIGPVLIETLAGIEKEYSGGRDIAKNINTRVLFNEKEYGRSGLLEVDYVIGAIILLRNADLKRISLFDPAFFFSGEVADLCHRASLVSSINVIELSARGYHHAETNPMRTHLYKYYSLRNRFVFMRKYIGYKTQFLKWSWFLLKELAYNVLTLNKKGTKTMLILINDVFHKTTGNQNHKFDNII